MYLLYFFTNHVGGFPHFSVQLEIEECTRKLRIGDFLGPINPEERYVDDLQRFYKVRKVLS